jgi:hypothetical protein
MGQVYHQLHVVKHQFVQEMATALFDCPLILFYGLIAEYRQIIELYSSHHKVLTGKGSICSILLPDLNPLKQLPIFVSAIMKHPET